VQRSQVARTAALAALAVAIFAVLVILFSSSSSYVLHAQFTDAGQLVGGDLVTVGGHQVGAVGKITLTRNGLADVELDIGDSSVTPIHAGTLATIGQLSLTGVANRFVGLTLSPAGPKIPSGGTLPPTQTRGIVDLDVLLNSLTPPVRRSLQQLLRTGAYFVHSPTAKQLNQGSVYLNPALNQTAGLAGEIVADRFALSRFVASTAQLTSGLAARSPDLTGAVSHTAAALRQIASQRAALADLLTRTPGVLGQARSVLADTNFALGRLDPTLTDLQPVAPKLATLLRVLLPAARDAVPTIAGIQSLVPSAEAALAGLPPVEKVATPAVNSLTRGLTGITPILAGLRPYAPDLVSGFFNGVGGSTGASYDANGHYLKSELLVQAGGESLSGLLSLLGPLTGSLGSFNGVRTGLIAPCPGGGTPPSADGSAPWNSPDVPSSLHLCNPAHNQKP
jgi:phospholipid/cholesterol/gamma-HCH transport system substrate-binding protein